MTFDPGVTSSTKFGDGSDGSYTSGNNLEPGVEHNFTDLVLNSGDTLTTTSVVDGKPPIVRVQGDVEINGTVDLNQKGYPGGQGLTTNTMGAGVSGAKVNTGHGSPGVSGQKVNLEGGTNKPRGGDGGTEYPGELYMNDTEPPLVFSGTGGGGGRSFDPGDNTIDCMGGGGGASYNANGSGGGQNFNTNTFSSDNGSGGQGGGSIAFIVGGNFSFTGTIDIRGGDGQNATDGGGGGGAGGMFYSLYSGALTDTGTKQVSGGNGGNGTANGGNGANGTVLFEKVS